MNVHTHSVERRQVLATARRYRRDGYEVSGLDDRAARPSFLGDFEPDLIAVRDDDKVVIEVKRAPSVRGSNDLVELAELVSAQPGWRFELIAVPDAVRTAMPELSGKGGDLQQLLDKGYFKAAFVVGYAMVENMVGWAAFRSGSKRADSSPSAMNRDLVVRGIIDEETRDEIEKARNTRDTILLDIDRAFALKREDVEPLLRLGSRLRRDLLAEGEP